MFEQIQEQFKAIFRNLRGFGKITDKNISETGREIRRALLEADVNYKVARDFVDRVVEKAKGAQVLRSITPGEQFVKLIHDELTHLLGDRLEPLGFSETPPTVILLAGLQGSGKTTTAAKLAAFLKHEGKKPYLVAADVYRPAAVDQLKILGEEIGVPVWWEEYRDPVKTCMNGIENARSSDCDVVILDSAGRLHVDSEMMEEIIEIAEATEPHETLFVADGMTGQDAVNSAKAFSLVLDITGTILTKMDGDARGGAAVSITAATGRPIKFIGTNERAEGLESFHPERMAGRILGMGDVVTLVEKAEQVVDREQAQEMAEKLKKQDFTLEDFLGQIGQLRKMGPLGELVSMIPGIGKLGRGVQLDENQIDWMEAIINSMTREERINPSIIDGSRRKRIALGSGRPVQEVNRLLKEFSQLRKVIENFSKMKVNRNMMKQFSGISN